MERGATPPLRPDRRVDRLTPACTAAVFGAGRRLAQLTLAVAVLAVLDSAPSAAASTFCTVTINSSQERLALRAAFPQSRFVELTEYGASAAPAGWLPRACEAGVQCDVLLISGHFARKFFGDSPFELSLQALQRQACQRTCDGVLTRPRVVFLFGCNTLAGKALDRRTPEVYRQVLLQDGLAPEFADRVAALRYGPLGEETRARMRKVFSQDALLLGYSSVGPVGAVAGPVFGQFLRDARAPLVALLSASGDRARARLALGRSWVQAFHGFTPDVAQGGTPFTADECLLADQSEGRLERLRGAERLLAEDPLRHALVVWDLLRAHGDWQPPEVEILERLRGNASARRELLAALPHLTGSLDTYFSMLQFVRFLGWVDEDAFGRLQAGRLATLFRDGVTPAERDFLCVSRLSYAPSAKQLASNRGSVTFIESLPCLTARSGAVRTFLLAHLAQPSETVRLAALESLTDLSLLEPADTARLRSMFHVATDEVRASILLALGASDGDNLEVQRFIAEAASDPDEDVAWTSTQVVGRLHVDDPIALRSLARALSRPDGFVRRAAALALATLAAHDARTLDVLGSHLDDPDDVVRTAAASAVAEAGRQRAARGGNDVHRPGGTRR